MRKTQTMQICFFVGQTQVLYALQVSLSELGAGFNDAGNPYIIID